MDIVTGPRARASDGLAERQEPILRLLVVDDDAVDRMAVRRTLRETGLAGVAVDEAADAEGALAALGGAGGAGGQAFDCVLLDYQLGGHTGLDVLRLMADGGHVVPAIVLTGRSDPETVAALMKGGAADFLTKDALTPERLEQSIRGAVRIARAERGLAESRALLAATLRSIADAVITVDADARVTYMNPAAERLTGWLAPDALRRGLEEVAVAIAAEEALDGGDGAGSAAAGGAGARTAAPRAAASRRDAPLHERVRQVLGGRRDDERADMTLRTRDGTPVVVDATVTPLRDATGATSGGVVALRDITARRRAEAALAGANRELQAQADALEQQAAELEQQFEEAQALTAELEQANDHLQEAHLDTERSEARYRALVEASARLVWATDARGRVEDMPGWRALTGQRPEQVRGDGWVDAVHPDDRGRCIEIWQAAFGSGEAYDNVYRLRLADGSYRWYRARGVPVVDAAGEIREWVGTLTDIDEERRTEDARREEADLVETLHRIGGVLSSELDLERIVQTVTDAATSLTGAQFGAFFYNVVDQQGEKLTLYTLSGAPREAFQDFAHPRATPVFEPTFHGTAIVRSDDITADPRYGQMAPHHGMPPGHLPVRSYLAVPVVSRHGDVIGGLIFGHAATGVFTARAERLVSGIAASAAVAMDNARLYQAERWARAEAEAANKAKSDFLASMSHELRTPLNAIGGYADLVLEGIRGPVTEAQRADLERIKRSQHHLLSLINDILNFAKIEAGRVRFDLADVSMNQALGGLEELIAPQLRERGLRYEYRCCDARFTAHADPERLQQILLNLLSNAVKFTPTGGEVVVECDATPDTMLVRVHDTGIGIPPDKLEQIFEPFVQLDRGQARQNAGTGLGLSISRDLARAMGGDLTAESGPDAGSTFTLTLPRRASPHGPRGGPQGAPGGSPAAARG